MSFSAAQWDAQSRMIAEEFERMRRERTGERDEMLRMKDELILFLTAVLTDIEKGHWNTPARTLQTKKTNLSARSYAREALIHVGA